MKITLRTAVFTFDGNNTIYMVMYAPSTDKAYNGYICRVSDIGDQKELSVIITKAAANKSNALGYLKQALNKK